MTLDLETVKLGRGNHSPSSDEPCVMEAASILAGETWSDSPACVSPVIAAFLRRWNDDLGDEDRQMLRPYARKVLGTNTGAADDERRAWMLTDWMVRVYLPSWLRVAKLDAHAAAVESPPELTDAACWDTARPAVEAAKKSSDAASAAGWDAGWDAARDAARDAASDAASDAAWAAAKAAAKAAARDAAESALKPTVVMLQQSARDLLDRMIAVGKVV